MGYGFGAKSRKELATLHPNLQQVFLAAIRISEQDFCVFDGGRTAAEQNKLFKKGASQKDGYKNKSNHQEREDGYGYAGDLVPWVNGKPLWDDSWELHYKVADAVSRAAKSLDIRIRWGGNWYEIMNDYGDGVEAMKAAVIRYKKAHPGPDFIDAPHFELA